MAGKVGQRRLHLEDRVRAILSANPIIDSIMSRADQIDLPNWHLCAGCLAQSVWNARYGYPPQHGVGDIDLVYFDNTDLSKETEAEGSQRIRNLFSDFDIWIDVKNQARVHLWYETRFGKPIPPFQSVAHAVACFPTTATAIAARIENGKMSLIAPFGYEDLLRSIVRPNKRLATQDVYEAKIARWQRFWPQLTYFPWDEP
jgi:hypothetical protein